MEAKLKDNYKLPSYRKAQPQYLVRGDLNFNFSSLFLIIT